MQKREYQFSAVLSGTVRLPVVEGSEKEIDEAVQDFLKSGGAGDLAKVSYQASPAFPGRTGGIASLVAIEGEALLPKFNAESIRGAYQTAERIAHAQNFTGRLDNVRVERVEERSSMLVETEEELPFALE